MSVPAGVWRGRGGCSGSRTWKAATAGAAAINLTVRQLTVRPVRAHVGDPVRHRGMDRQPGGRKRDDLGAEVYVNKKRVAKQMFRWGTPGMERTSKLNIAVGHARHGARGVQDQG
jgi:hypothetical protein